MYVKVKTPKWKLTEVNTIEYDMKLYQVKMTVLIKELKIITSHKNVLVYTRSM